MLLDSEKPPAKPPQGAYTEPPHRLDRPEILQRDTRVVVMAEGPGGRAVEYLGVVWLMDHEGIRLCHTNINVKPDDSREVSKSTSQFQWMPLPFQGTTVIPMHRIFYVQVLGHEYPIPGL